MMKLPINTHSTGFATSVLVALLIVLYVVCVTNSARRFSYDAGMEKYDAGDFAGAIADFRVDVQDRPGHSLGHYYLACSLVQTNQRSEARAEFEKAYEAELHSGSPDAVFAAMCLAKAKSLDNGL